MFKKIFLSLLILSPSFVTATELPFTDVPTGASYYADLKHMYDAGVIGDTADNLFHPDGLLPRDEFVGIIVGVSCRKCIYPTPEDVMHYIQDPFVDILKQNKYFYCISYAKEKEIVRGYVLDATGKTQCQNEQTFSEVPFCPANNITRIEAAAVLLRQAGLWSESQNSGSYEKKIVIADADTYWYGYAQKAVEIGLVALDSDKKLFPNEYITRKEFVIMASKIFTINMCSAKNNNEVPSDFASVIKIWDKEKNNCSSSVSPTTFPNNTETTYDFGGYATGSLTPPLQYDWTFTNTTTGEQIIATGSCLDNFNLGSTGLWTAKLVIIDANGGSSTAYQQVSVGNNNSTGSGGYSTGTGISLQIGTTDTNNTSGNPLNTSATTLYGTIGIPMPFFSTTTGGDGKYSYYWDFSDRGTASIKDPSHIFTKEGVYPVTLIVRDTSGNIAYAQLTVVISPNLDRDGDGVLDYDSSGRILDACPDVFGPASNKGCPIVNEYNWGDLNGGYTVDNSNGNGGFGSNGTMNNLCLSNKIKASGLIEGNVQCASCPCIYSSDFIAKVRSCDIIFPSITSPDKKTLYSRGSIFPVP